MDLAGLIAWVQSGATGTCQSTCPGLMPNTHVRTLAVNFSVSRLPRNKITSRVGFRYRLPLCFCTRIVFVALKSDEPDLVS